MEEALLEMTEKRLGCVGIVNKAGNLEGIITDGDLRRFISKDMFSKKPIDVMTRNPKSTSKDILASEAVRLMNEKQITQLFVLDNQKPVGVLHLHDYLRAGVA